MSDHDVFVVTTDGVAGPRAYDLSWLPAAERIVLVFPETVHGRGVVYDDGHLVELAVFDNHELELARVNVYRVFLDRAGIADRLGRHDGGAGSPPRLPLAGATLTAPGGSEHGWSRW